MPFEVVKKQPRVFEAGHSNYYFNFKTFWKWIAFAFIHGAMTFLFVMEGLDGPIDSEGKTYDLWFRSSLAFTVLIIVVTIKLALELNTFNVSTWY